MEDQVIRGAEVKVEGQAKDWTDQISHKNLAHGKSKTFLSGEKSP